VRNGKEGCSPGCNNGMYRMSGAELHDGEKPAK
jgi:hypothetical protein